MCMFKDKNIVFISDNDDEPDNIGERNKSSIFPVKAKEVISSEPLPYIRTCTVDNCENICRGEQGLTAHLKSMHGIPTWGRQTFESTECP